MDLGIRGRTAFVAAASRGLGFAIADALAAEGVNIACCARSESVYGRAGELSQQHGVDALGIVAGVAVPDDVTRAVGAAVERFGAVDILVTNAGGPPPAPSSRTTPRPGRRRSRSTSKAW